MSYKEESQLIYNAIKTPDGTILESRHSRDFKRHVQEDGREYFIDGGLSCPRVGFSDQEYVNLSLTLDDDHAIIRDRFTWGSILDKDGNPLPEKKYVKLKDLTDEHLKALVAWTEEGYAWYIHAVIVNEYNYRRLK